MTVHGLPIGTRVRRRSDVRFERLGTVAHHQPQYSEGRFPVCFDDGVWETHDATDVVVLPGDTGLRRWRAKHRTTSHSVHEARTT